MRSMILLLVVLAIGNGFAQASWAEAKGKPKIAKPIFFPSEPDEPRLQYLTSFSSSEDFEKSPGAFKKFIVGNETVSKAIVKPYGVKVHQKKVYVCDTVHNRVVILNFMTRKFEYFKPADDIQLIDPISIDFDADDNMYIADARKGQVFVFDSEAHYLGVIGKSSESKPAGILVSKDEVFVCDLKSHAVKVYSTKDRSYVRMFPAEGAAPEARLFSPTNIASDKEGNIYVTDTGSFRVQVYDHAGNYLRTIGAQGDSVGQFARPKGVALDNEARVYVVDAAFENVQIFDKEGKALLFFAEPGGSTVPLVLPAGIAIDYSLKPYFAPLISPDFEVEYLVFVTSQYGDRKLSVFGFGHKK